MAQRWNNKAHDRDKCKNKMETRATDPKTTEVKIIETSNRLT
jgi:hypothetical protein